MSIEWGPNWDEGLAGGQESAPLDQQLYVWQRQWRPAHAEALAQSRADEAGRIVADIERRVADFWDRIRR